MIKEMVNKESILKIFFLSEFMYNFLLILGQHGTKATVVEKVGYAFNKVNVLLHVLSFNQCQHSN